MPPREIEAIQTSETKTWHPNVVMYLVACILGGLLGGGIVHQIHPVFEYTDLPQIGLGASDELILQHRIAAFEYRSKNYGVELAIVGLSLGLAIGAFSGSPKRMLSTFAGGIAGALTGGIVGYVGGLIVGQSIIRNEQQGLQASMGLQTIVWGLILASVVWSVATLHVGAKRACSHLLIGLIAGFAVAVTQFVISSVVFPSSNPLFLIPEQPSERVYWLAAFPIVSGLIVAMGVAKLSRK